MNTLILDKIGFRGKKIIRNKLYFAMISQSNQQKDIIILIFIDLITEAKIRKAKLMTLQGALDKYILIH